MKRIISSTNNSMLSTVAGKLKEKYEILSAKTFDNFFIAPYVIMFKSNGNNVYRVIFGRSFQTGDIILCFQAVAEAFYVDGKEYYDEAQDYKFDRNVRPADIASKIIQYTTECDNADPKFTNYPIMRGSNS